MFRKNKLAMLVGEFLGTTGLTLTVLAISHSQLSLAYFIATAAGLTFTLLTLALGGISGAVFNPAITIGLWTVRKLRTLQAIAYLVVQLLGGLVAWELFVYLTKVSGVHNTDTYAARTLVAEVLGTFVFAFIWAGAVYQRFGLFARAAAIGGGLTAGSLMASLGSAGLLNPAVALGLKQWGWGTYVLGPVLGAIIGFNLYNLLFVSTEVAAADEATAATATAASTRTSAVSKTGKPAASAKAPVRKPAAKKAPARKPAAKKTTAKRRNPNAA